MLGLRLYDITSDIAFPPRPKKILDPLLKFSGSNTLPTDIRLVQGNLKVSSAWGSGAPNGSQSLYFIPVQCKLRQLKYNKKVL